ncbi:hypothetical protein PF003_g12342 [Phytophthora fragariae]|nr:hypothetical protein PF003_g12342 [Phytophthora fragariae]
MRNIRKLDLPEALVNSGINASSAISCTRAHQCLDEACAIKVSRQVNAALLAFLSNTTPVVKAYLYM